MLDEGGIPAYLAYKVPVKMEKSELGCAYERMMGMLRTSIS